MKTKKTAPKTPKADTVESLLKQRDEIDAKIRELQRPYKIGDRVLIVGKITDEDVDDDSNFPYLVEFEEGDDLWFSLSDIRGKA